VAQWISRAGDTFTWLALAVRVDSLFAEAGDSARALGGMLFSFALPQLLFGLFAGTLVDRWDRRRVMIVSDLARAALVPAFLLLRSADDLPWLYAVAFLHSSFSVFFYPARSALLPAIVANEELMSANGWLQLGDTVARLTGPVLAGIVVGRFGMAPALAVDSASFVASAALLMGIGGVKTTVAEAPGRPSAAWEDLKNGLRFAARSRLVQGVTLGLGLALLGIGGIDSVIVPFLRHVFAAPPEALGVVMTVQGVGMAVGGLAIGRLGRRLTPLAVAVGSMVLLGVGVALVGLAPDYGMILAVMPFVGLSLPPLNASLQTLVQQGVPAQMLGRASAVTDTTITICQLISLAGIGWVAAEFGMRETFYLAGLMIAVGGLAMRWVLSKSDRPREAVTPAPYQA
jgi:MFS family permease